MTDSEKELKLRTRSEGRRTPRLKRNNRACSEKNLDTLYLKAASQPKHVEYAQLKPTNKLQVNMDYLTKATSDYVILQKLRTPKPNYLESTAIEQQTSIRQTLVAITEDYKSDQLSVVKGDVVTLVACKSYQQKGSIDYQQWFFIRNRDGTEGYIPAKVAGHGFL
jgi:DNA-binding GntR family transcriptional regulator